MNAADDTGRTGRRAPRGRNAHLWLIEHVPHRYEPNLRGAATAVRNRRLRIRLFRERWIRRLRRSLRRSERTWRRRMRTTTRFAAQRQRTSLRAGRRRARRIRPAVQALRHKLRPTPTRRQGREHGEPISRDDTQPAQQLAWEPPGRLARVLFPATVRLLGDGELVAIDATGHSTAAIIECQDRLPRRVLVVTDAPSVGALRTAGIPYEYLPTATALHSVETFPERLLWLDYVYGIDRVERLDRYAAESSNDST